MVFIFIVHVISINDVAIAPADARFALFHFHYATTEEEQDQDEGVLPFSLSLVLFGLIHQMMSVVSSTNLLHAYKHFRENWNCCLLRSDQLINTELTHMFLDSLVQIILLLCVSGLLLSF